MLSPESIRQIADATRAWAAELRTASRRAGAEAFDLYPVILPHKFAEWLAARGPEWQREFAETDPGAVAGDIITHIGLTAAATAYAHPITSPPPVSLIEQLAAEIRFTQFGDQRAVERVLVHGARLPADTQLQGDPSWDRCWPAALGTLLRLIRDIAHRQLGWIASQVVNPPRRDHRWTTREAAELAELLTLALTTGRCGCWSAWDDFSLKEAEARANCEHEHTLANWNGEGEDNDLESFLFRAVCRGALLLNASRTDSTHYAPRIRDFRVGMLAKEVRHPDTAAALRAGFVLRCGRPACSGEIRPESDTCDVCKKPVDVEEPTMWLFFDGERGRRDCLRCARSTRLRDDHVRDWKAWAEVLLAEEQNGPPAPGHRLIQSGGTSEMKAALAAIRDGRDNPPEVAAARAAATTAFNDALKRSELFDPVAWVLREEESNRTWLDQWREESGLQGGELAELGAWLRCQFEAAKTRLQKRNEQREAGGKDETEDRTDIRRLNRQLLQVTYHEHLTRCGCNRLYFGGKCLRCELLGMEANWSQKPTQVWVQLGRAGSLPDDPPAPPDGAEEESEQRDIDLVRRRLAETWKDGPEKELALLLFGGLPREEALAEALERFGKKLEVTGKRMDDRFPPELRLKSR